MKSVTLKRNISSLFLIVGITLGCATIQATPSLPHEDIAYVNSITTKLKNMIDETQKTLESFVNPKDKTPFNNYVNQFDTQFNKLNNEIIAPLKAKIAKKDHISPLYHQALVITNEILTDLYQQLNSIRAVLKSHKDGGKKAIVIASELLEQVKALTNKHNELDAKLAKLHECLHQLQLINLVKEVAQIRAILKEAKNAQDQRVSKTQQMDIVRAIRLKLEAKK